MGTCCLQDSFPGEVESLPALSLVQKSAENQVELRATCLERILAVHFAARRWRFMYGLYGPPSSGTSFSILLEARWSEPLIFRSPS